METLQLLRLYLLIYFVVQETHLQSTRVGNVKDEGKVNAEHSTENILGVDGNKRTDTKPMKPVGTYFESFLSIEVVPH